MPSTLRIGTILSERYRIVALLGRGGFGAVYRAWDTSLTRPCAIKENLDTSPEIIRQFTREAQVLANLSHPNLPRVTDHFIIPNQGQYLVMDFIDGKDLANLIQEQGAVPPAQAIIWIAQVADALSYLHSRKPPILHRDIKPANIRLTPEGRVFLVDFGLVKEYDPYKATTLGARAVTPGYSPIEQYGAGTTDERSDIYALGATLYALLTGQQPPESVSRIVQDNLVAAQQINPQISSPIGQVISHAMAIQPENRYRNVNEFAAELTGKIQPPTPDSTIRVAATAPAKIIDAQAPPKPAPSKRSSIPRWLPITGLALLGILCVFAGMLVLPRFVPNLPFGFSSADTQTPTPSSSPTEETILPVATTIPVIEFTTTPTLTPSETPTTPVTWTPTPSPTLSPTQFSTPTNTPTLPPTTVYDLAFASDRSGMIQTYLMDSSDTTRWIVLVNPPEYNRAWWPSFCGEQIAVEAQDLSGRQPSWIYMLNPLSSSATRWIPAGEEPPRLGVPRCSPDSRFMAYSSRIEDGWELIVVENSTSMLTSIYRAAISGFTSWPIFGEVFYSMARAGSNFEIRRTINFLTPSAIENQTIIPNAKFPAISPDGSTLAFICNDTTNICLRDLPSGETRTLFTLDYVRIDDTAMPATVAWSGDGNWLYFASADGGDWDIFRIRPDGSGIENLTSEWSSNELMPDLKW